MGITGYVTVQQKKQNIVEKWPNYSNAYKCPLQRQKNRVPMNAVKLYISNFNSLVD